MRDAAGRSRCFAFLTFDEPASVNAVMVREHFLDGKIVSKCMEPRSLHLSNLDCSIVRLTPNEPSLGKNISVPQNYLLEVLLVA
jgi:hypothetical protein